MMVNYEDHLKDVGKILVSVSKRGVGGCVSLISPPNAEASSLGATGFISQDSSV